MSGSDMIKTALMMVLVVQASASYAYSASIQDLVRIKGLEDNTVMGLGLVTGLDGTGDTSRDSFIAARPYAELLRNLGNPIGSLEELEDADSFALVRVSMEIPAGSREGDRYDITVSTMFNATSLAGGELVVSLLRLPVKGGLQMAPLAMGSGTIQLQGENPRTGVVRSGGQMLQSIQPQVMDDAGRIQLVLHQEFAVFTVAQTLSSIINDEFGFLGHDSLARVIDPKTIQVMVPERMRRDPSKFISSLMGLHVDETLLRTPARIVINEAEGVIVATENVQIKPVAIAAAGLQITSITPKMIPTPMNPELNVSRWAGVSTSEPMSTSLIDLLSALDQLDVPVSDQIDIIYELRRSGALAAEIISR